MTIRLPMMHLLFPPCGIVSPCSTAGQPAPAYCNADANVLVLPGGFSVGSLQQTQRIGDLILCRTLAGVEIEVLHRLVGDGLQVVARDIDLAQPRGHPSARIEGLELIR